MDKKKYEFTGETQKRGLHTLHRIRAIIDIPKHGVSAGDLGGWIEEERNLSHEGSAWVADSAIAYDDSLVADDALVSGNARVFDAAAVRGCSVVRNHAVVASSYVGGEAHVYDSAVVAGHSRVDGTALVHMRSVVSTRAYISDGKIGTDHDYITVGPVGSRSDHTTLNLTTGTVCTGCFKGTLDEFAAAVKRRHGDCVHGKQYAAVLNLFRTMWDLRQSQQK